MRDKKFLINEKAYVRNITAQDLVPDKKIVVTIPDDLPLTAAEKFYRRLRLKAHFHDQANNETSSELRD